MNWKNIKTLCEFKPHEVYTKFIDAHEAIDVEFINGPDPETFVEVFKRFSTLSWFDDYKNYLVSEDLGTITKDFLDGRILAQGLESGIFTFVFKNLSLHNSHALVRTRIGATYLQQSQAVSDFRHSNILVPPALQKYPELLDNYKLHAIEGKRLYGKLLDTGNISIDDARMCMSKAVPVWLGCSFSLLSLMNIYSKRTDTQEEAYVFNIVFEKLKNKVLEKYPYLESLFVKDNPAKCIHTRSGWKSNCIYKRDEYHQVSVEDEFTLHDKTKIELVKYKPYESEYYIENNKVTKAIYESSVPKTNYL